MRGMSTKYVIFLISLIAILMVSYIFLIPKQTTTVKTTTTMKVKAICGNNICDQGEDRFECCSDCQCQRGEICNEVKQRCEIEFSLSEDAAKNSVRQYLDNNDYSMVVDGVTTYNGEKVMLVYVSTPDIKLFAVDENSVVTEIELD